MVVGTAGTKEDMWGDIGVGGMWGHTKRDTKDVTGGEEWRCMWDTLKEVQEEVCIWGEFRPQVTHTRAGTHWKGLQPLCDTHQCSRNKQEEMTKGMKKSKEQGMAGRNCCALTLSSCAVHRLWRECMAKARGMETRKGEERCLEWSWDRQRRRKTIFHKFLFKLLSSLYLNIWIGN